MNKATYICNEKRVEKSTFSVLELVNEEIPSMTVFKLIDI